MFLDKPVAGRRRTQFCGCFVSESEIKPRPSPCTQPTWIIAMFIAGYKLLSTGIILGIRSERLISHKTRVTTVVLRAHTYVYSLECSRNSYKNYCASEFLQYYVKSVSFSKISVDCLRYFSKCVASNRVSSVTYASFCISNDSTNKLIKIAEKS